MESIRLETNLRNVDGRQVLDVKGEVDVYTAPQFKEAVNKMVDSGEKHILIDMSGVRYMDSSGFGTLLSVMKRLKPNGGSINLINVSSPIDRILKITRLNQVFATYPSVDEAIRATQESGSSAEKLS
ncbi:MAG: STAS domain-containing protein [Armatimonadota bacterium]|nr:STAS domain-containing protein [Armatimonadota bacterium]